MEEISTTIEAVSINESSTMEEIKAKNLNEEPEREIIKLSELSVNGLDPLEYFSGFLDILEMIFQHLNGEEMINISEVSPTYYNFIASSKLLMKKIKIVFDDNWTLNQEEYDLLKNSSRLYQCIEFRGSREVQTTSFVCKKEFRFFFEKTREWKEMEIVNTLFENELDLWELLSAIQPTVERLTFDGVRFRNSLNQHNFALGYTNLVFARPSLVSTYNSWEFPKLKELKLICFKNREVATILSRAVDVEKLELREVHKKTSIKMLKYFDKLTSLKLYFSDMRQIFENDVSNEFQFKLKSFALSFKDATWRPYNAVGTQNQNVCSNFPKFLLSQSDHLEELFDVTEFDSSCYSETEKYLECFNLIMKMPKLKRLGLRYFPNLSEDEAIFHVPNEISSSITELRLEETLCAESFKFLLQSMPNLKKLQIFSFSQEMFQTLNAMKRKFDELILTNLEISLNNLNQILINEDWKDIQLKLNRLSIGSEQLLGSFGCIWMLSENARQNLQNFLKSQSYYLEELALEISCDCKTFKSIMKMRKLRSLSLERFSVFSTNEGPTEISTSITDLELARSVNSDGLKYLLESMPNVERLTIFSIDQEIFETLVSMKRKFGELKVHKLTEIEEESLKRITEKLSFF